MVVLVLLLLWVAALLPIALKKRSEWELSSSVSRFRRSNRSLSRTRPQLVAVGEGAPPSAGRAASLPSPERLRAERRLANLRRARRRRVLGVLLGTLVGSFLLGAIPPLRDLWDLSLAATLLAFAYCALLVRLARAEQDTAQLARKVASLQPTGEAVVVPLAPRRPSFVIVEAEASSGGF